MCHEFVGDLVGDRNEGRRVAQQTVAQPQRHAHRCGGQGEPGPGQAGAEELARELTDAVRLEHHRRAGQPARKQRGHGQDPEARHQHDVVAAPQAQQRPAGAPPFQGAPPAQGQQQMGFSPPNILNLEDTGLSILWLQDLALKILYYQGYLTGFKIAEAMALPFTGLVDQLLVTMDSAHRAMCPARMARQMSHGSSVE